MHARQGGTATCRRDPLPGLFLWGVAVIIGALLPAVTGRADALSVVQMLREGGCGGLVPAARAPHRSALLDQAARYWAAGDTAAAAAQRSGYPVRASATWYVSGPHSSLADALMRAPCGRLADRNLQDIGIYQRGADTWIYLASAHASPVGAPAPMLRALQLVNEARARGARCGSHSFAPAPPLAMSTTLAQVAWSHAADMAQNNYFEHEDLAGHSPADRVRAVGYRETLVGENIAYGPESAEEVVRGWLDSPGHCENIMNARFAEMGVADVPGSGAQHGRYWVQVLAAPRAYALRS